MMQRMAVDDGGGVLEVVTRRTPANTGLRREESAVDSVLGGG
jgi:hypothetical protein